MKTLEGMIQKLGGILRAHEERLRDVENALADVIKEKDDLKKHVAELEEWRARVNLPPLDDEDDVYPPDSSQTSWPRS